MKKILRFFTVALTLPLVGLSGCLFETDPEDSAVSGFKVLSYSQEYQLDDTISAYSNFILEQLYANFCILNDNAHPSLISNKPDVTGENFDKIRVEALADETNAFARWNWTIANNTAGAVVQDNSANQEQYYSVPATQAAYYDAFVSKYSVALEIVVMQIITGQTPTVFTVEASGAETKVYFDNAKTKEITTQECEALAEQREIFVKNARYIGLTEQNIETLKAYIKTHVIGQNKIGTAYDKIIVGGNAQNYDYVLNQILELEPELNKSIFEPYPLSTLKDYKYSDMFVSNNADALGHITAQEYQSIVIKADENVGIMSAWLALEAEYNVTINVKVNYYNSVTQSYKTLASRNVAVSAGKWDASDIVNLDFDRINIPKWNDPTAIAATNALDINNANGSSEYYTVSDAGVGILDGETVGSSYIEIVFEVQKDNSKNYWPFKVGFDMLWME